MLLPDQPLVRKNTWYNVPCRVSFDSSTTSYMRVRVVGWCMVATGFPMTSCKSNSLFYIGPWHA